jgi:hypothetical protein
VTHVLRGLQRWTVEGAHLRKYEAEVLPQQHGADRPEVVLDEVP